MPPPAPHSPAPVPPVPPSLPSGVVQRDGDRAASLDSQAREDGRAFLQQRPEAVDARTDLYALGAVGYYLLTGHDVFSGRNVLEVCGHHLHTEPVAPSQRSAQKIPEDLEALILACLRKAPSARPRDASALQAQLRACKDAGRWDEEEARQWFARHGEALRTRSSRTTVSGAATIAVDLGRRL